MIIANNYRATVTSMTFTDPSGTERSISSDSKNWETVLGRSLPALKNLESQIITTLRQMIDTVSAAQTEGDPLDPAVLKKVGFRQAGNDFYAAMLLSDESRDGRDGDEVRRIMLTYPADEFILSMIVPSFKVAIPVKNRTITVIVHTELVELRDPVSTIMEGLTKESGE